MSATARRAAALLLLGAGTAAAVGAPMGREDFRAFAEGWTLHFETLDGAPFGAETYRPGGEAVWKPEGGACAIGVWSESRGRICFLYDAGMSCWRVYREGGAVTALSDDGEEPRIALRVARRDRAPVACGDDPSV
jgi:hypothetical protein